MTNTRTLEITAFDLEPGMTIMDIMGQRFHVWPVCTGIKWLADRIIATLVMEQGEVQMHLDPNDFITVAHLVQNPDFGQSIDVDTGELLA